MEVACPTRAAATGSRVRDGLCRRPEGLTRAAVLAGSHRRRGFRAVPHVLQGKPLCKGLRGALPAKRMVMSRSSRTCASSGDLGLRFDLNVSPDIFGRGGATGDRMPARGSSSITAATPIRLASSDRPCRAPAPSIRPSSGDSISAGSAPRATSSADLRHRVSGPGTRLAAEDLAPIINHCLEAFGPDRVSSPVIACVPARNAAARLGQSPQGRGRQPPEKTSAALPRHAVEVL